MNKQLSVIVSKNGDEFFFHIYDPSVLKTSNPWRIGENGKHSYHHSCGGKAKFIKINKGYNVVICEKCLFRIEIPVNIETQTDLLIHFKEFNEKNLLDEFLNLKTIQ